ncbi:endoplasmic reticulum-Golgi intermediate compartment protein 2 [Apiospora kogelbergensis]|uniref:endoplasmic reticulum-Golgi intermediate compartment protein 2 n=1 Tax=Apiospora kogelbergensis TaxID=1337665 RepID=UPI00313276E7
MMNGYEKHGGFDEPEPNSFVKAFDAFPKSKPQYVTRTSGGGKWSVVMYVVSLLLLWTELGRWWRGTENHTFAVEKSVGHSLQINLDIILKMQCKDLHVNVQDAAGDRILAATRLQEDATRWDQWVDSKGVHKLGMDSHGKAITGAGWHDEEGFGEEHVHDIVALGKKKARWGKTPASGGDFHITARGHGYMEFGEHLDHSQFNFSHIINEFSFGPYFPSLVNPLDRTVNQASAHFHKFQYFMSVVPTVYTVGQAHAASSTIFTNQYAVTEQSHEISEFNVPGIFFKYDIEPILLTVEETRDGFLTFAVKVINVLSGVLVACHWGFTLSEWLKEVWGRRRRIQSQGMIGVEKRGYDE